MLDGPKVGLIVLALALALVGLGIYLVERRHWRRSRDREPKRLPLFGTEQLAIRSADGEEYDVAPAPSRPITRARAAEPALPLTPSPGHTTGNGRASLPRPEPLLSPFAPPATPLAGPPAAREPFRPTHAPTGSAVASSSAVERSVPTMRPPAAGPMGHTANGVPDLAMIEGETLRFTIPSDGTVEFLPGRLEIVAGPEAGREIRFVRTPGEVDVEVTFGRSEGPPNRHVQILARTVSRRHAVMMLIDQHWQLVNLSATNPVVLNGRVLADNEVAPLLVEGDRIEMGEVGFVFHDD